MAEEYAALQFELSESARNLSPGERGILDRMRITPEIMGKRVSELSGGETTKVMLAKVLLRAGKQDLLVLDEPTSHLDIETVEWLEDHLLGLDCAQLIVSHDRYFLNDVVTRVIELEGGTLRGYTGNYTEFMEKRTLDVERRRKEAEKNRIERDRQARVADELHRRERFGTNHKTRKKMIDRMDVIEPPEKDDEIMLRIGVKGKSGKNMVLAKDLGVRRGRTEVIRDLNLNLLTGDKLGIFGPNGAGKTTLVKALLYELPCEGELWIAPGARIGYYAQGHDMLDNTLTSEQQLLKAMGEDERLMARKLLARLLLIGEDVERPIGTLSGGERARVALALLIADRRNFLILDEPTNYLDIHAKHAVESALSDYPGTLLIVTHDRYLMD
ncbi:MAG: ABC-F family ATP-binding cassette domain-containing protein, partial [Planctomycetes bacterium]|nr:ABC-F family ATP-binding cassette domain-containing protein [Planctomycetota bacterium]